MKKLLKVYYLDSYGNDTIEESQLDNYKQLENYAYHEEVTECEACGKETKSLEIIGILARCNDCAKNYEKSQQRAREYLSVPWNPYDNDYDE